MKIINSKTAIILAVLYFGLPLAITDISSKNGYAFLDGSTVSIGYRNVSNTVSADELDDAIVPDEPSDVYIDPSDNTLLVRKIDDRSYTLCIIKGVIWSPAARVPAEGPDPLTPDKKTQYGFFYDWAGP